MNYNSKICLAWKVIITENSMQFAKGRFHSAKRILKYNIILSFFVELQEISQLVAKNSRKKLFSTMDSTPFSTKIVLKHKDVVIYLMQNSHSHVNTKVFFNN